MHPTLLNAFGLRFHAYYACLAVAFLVCTLWAVSDGQRRNPPILGTPQGGLWAFLGALFGAKAFWILQYSEPKNIGYAFFLWRPGLVFYGGLIGGITALLIYVWWNRLPLLLTLDLCAPYLALGEAITRIGCFLNGCCWGSVTNVPWAVQFPKFSPAFRHQADQGLLDNSASASLPVHPTQLYMVIGLVLGFVLLRLLTKRAFFAGSVAASYCVIYGVVRFTVEAFRGDSARSIAGMTVSQTISAALIVIGATVWTVALVKRSGAAERQECEKNDDRTVISGPPDE